MAKVEAVRGMPIAPPPAGDKRRNLENKLIKILSEFGYKEFRVPIIERSELFSRSIGSATDIVEKEMYEFKDKKGLSICLRPEATAGIIRAGIDLGIFNSPQRIWCLGPMFRYERPQSGRSRQFDQLDIEAVGFDSPLIEGELLWLTSLIWRELKIKPRLQINALGTQETRAAYGKTLKAYLLKNSQELDEYSQKRLERSPLRILDSKDKKTKQIIKEAPLIRDYWDNSTHKHFEKVCDILASLDIEYEINYHLVRGLDYYDKMVFEWVNDDLGAQNTVCAGGRYDGLIAQLGGKNRPAVGLAIGMDRLLLSLGDYDLKSSQPELAVLILSDNEKQFYLLSQLKNALPNLILDCYFDSSGLKNKLRRAAKQDIQFVLILGEEELKNEKVTLRNMKEGKQEMLPLAMAIDKLKVL